MCKTSITESFNSFIYDGVRRMSWSRQVSLSSNCFHLVSPLIKLGYSIVIRLYINTVKTCLYSNIQVFLVWQKIVTIEENASTEFWSEKVKWTTTKTNRLLYCRCLLKSALCNLPLWWAAWQVSGPRLSPIGFQCVGHPYSSSAAPSPGLVLPWKIKK